MSEESYVVYIIMCIQNNRMYIGQTKNYKNRINNHKYHLKNNNHDNIYLQEDFNRYGLSSFTFKIIDICNKRQQAIEKETYWINYYGGINCKNLYNCKDMYHNNELMKDKLKQTAKNNPNYGMRNKAVTLQHRKRLSESRKMLVREGKIIPWNKDKKGLYITSEETKHKISKAIRGRKHTIETKQKISNSLKGKKFTEEHRKHLKESFKNRVYRKKYSQEQVEMFRTKYKELGSYNAVARYYNINNTSMGNLIKYGMAYPPKNK